MEVIKPVVQDLILLCNLHTYTEKLYQYSCYFTPGPMTSISKPAISDSSPSASTESFSQLSSVSQSEPSATGIHSLL
ncbi:hypothetical protein DPMN_176702 [Dreissena polymorpha]|uniref:Uncharacterized protein n=1 Tax=Dreissena polymorpha TaxID=45954 RepID=A0A9D4EAN6_DREPO|nr:hypothetical protein DPMN_176702 [Dreissena polymorpha]